MNDPSNRETLHSFLIPELEEDMHGGFSFNLLYRKSIDGAIPATKCKGAGYTLTVIEDMNGFVFGSYAEGKWDKPSPNFVGKKSFFFCLAGKVPEKKDPFKSVAPKPTSIYRLYFGQEFYISSAGTGYCKIGSYMGSREECAFRVK